MFPPHPRPESHRSAQCTKSCAASPTLADDFKAMNVVLIKSLRPTPVHGSPAAVAADVDVEWRGRNCARQPLPGSAPDRPCRSGVRGVVVGRAFGDADAGRHGSAGDLPGRRASLRWRGARFGPSRRLLVHWCAAGARKSPRRHSGRSNRWLGISTAGTGDMLEHHVACLVSEGVVDAFEAVQIEHRTRQRQVVAAPARFHSRSR